jgi:pimeloyl-ACP methyl ester carboxylesterase
MFCFCEHNKIGTRHNLAHHRPVKRKRLILGAALLLVPPLAGWLAADQLAHPPRRPLQDYHHEFLSNPAAHGVALKSFTCADGTPCLVCAPDPHGALGKRGQVIREQLTLKGLTLPAPGNVVGNLVLVHGRRGRKEDYLLIAERFCAVREAHLPALALHEAAAKFGFNPQPAGIMGLSMGGAVSIRSAVEKDAPWRAAVLVSTFDSLDHVVRHQTSGWVGDWLGSVWSGMTGWFYQRKAHMEVSAANSLALVPQLKCPVLVAHGTSDRVIPIECGRRLYEALPSGIEKRWIEIPGADHDNVLITDFPIYAEMAEWMLRHVPQ